MSDIFFCPYPRGVKKYGQKAPLPLSNYNHFLTVFLHMAHFIQIYSVSLLKSYQKYLNMRN